jgi:hypothetical protein
MKSLRNRVRRIEKFLDKTENITVEGLELILSVMPKEYADAVRKGLYEIADETKDDDYVYEPGRHGRRGKRRSLYGKKINLVLDELPPEWADKLREKLDQK